jgi:hypothetical protein
VIRNEEGMVISAGAGSCSFLLDTLHAEAVACLKGVQATGELGISKIQVETDSVMLKMTMESNGFALAAVGGIVLEIKDLIRSLFTSSPVSFCPRVCNRVAHALAAQGCISPPNSVSRWDEVPPGVEDIVTSDITESFSKWNAKFRLKKQPHMQYSSFVP